MFSKKLFLFYFKNIIFVIIILLFTHCTSRSAQAKLKNNNRNFPSAIKGNSDKEFNEKIKTVKSFFFYPTSTTNQIIKHNYYVGSYSEKDEQPEWIAYKISPNSISKNIKRTNDYREDPLVKTQSASPSDYHGSGYDMGHLAPARTMSQNLTAMSESFYLSNISPQKASFNRGIWKRLEEKIRYWAPMNDSIYVVTGPILDHPIDQIGSNKITVPRAFYKTLISFKKGRTNGIAFMIPHKKSNKSIYSYVTSIDEIEKITGIDFYFRLDKFTQEIVEANTDINKWTPIN